MAAIASPGVSAAYDATLRAPACATVGSYCDSGALLVGRATLGPEQNQPNTVRGSCADGRSGAFHSDESLDQLTVSTLDGSPFAPGKTVRIEARVWAYAGYGSDKLDLYYAATASTPTWTFIGTLTPTGPGNQVLSTTYVLPAGARQAIRGHFRYGGSAGPCGAGSYDDHDDLVFQVGSSASDTTPPTVALTAPAAGASVLSPVTLKADATDDVAVARVEFRENASLLGAATTAPYSIVWSAAAGLHTVEAWAYDAAGNVAVSYVSFNAIVDTTPPVASVTAPTAGAAVYAPVAITASATDAVDVARVELWEGSSLLGTSASSWCSLSWSPPPGSHTVVARAYDTSGNMGSSTPVNFTVLADVTPPTVSLTSPLEGARVTATTRIAASASDAAGVKRVEFYVDATLLGTVTAPAYSVSWNPASAAVGPHVLTARAYDAAGNVGVSAPVTVTYAPDTAPPAVSMVTPQVGAVISGATTLEAAATDDVAVASVSFLADGGALGIWKVGGAPWSVQWNTTAWPNGPVLLAARATDTSGNAAQSAPVRAVVANTGRAYARYDGQLRVPRCAGAAAVCDSGRLLDGYGIFESNAPNSLSDSPSCQDPSSGYYHSTPSVDAIRVTSVGGSVFAPGATVRLDATVWASGSSTTTVYLYAKDGAAREYGLGTGWTYLGAFTPATAGLQTVSATYTLGASPLQAVRAVTRWYSTGASLCGEGAYNENDDLVFEIGLPDTTPPGVWMVAPADGAQVAGSVRVAAAAADVVGVVRVELYDGDVLLAQRDAPPYEVTWDTASLSQGQHTLTARAYDGAGNVGASAPLNVSVGATTAP